VTALVVALVVFGFVSTRDRRRVTTNTAIVGDSITVLIQHQLQHRLGTRYNADVRARNGARIDEMLEPLRTALRNNPRDVVVNLGTNDALEAATRPIWQPGFVAMVDALTREDCVVFMNINTEMRQGAASDRAALDINAAFNGVVRTHPNMHVIDWNGMVRKPAGDTLLQADRIHPSSKGQEVLTTSILRALDTDCRG
jgi:lysophospholipase L1-like esterase